MARLWALLLVVAACSDDGAEPGDRRTRYGTEARPVDLSAPTVEDGKRYPLVMVLHGFGANGFAQAAYFGMSRVADEGVFMLAPDGTVNGSGMQFWNADPACCDFGNQNPDDVGYLGDILDDVIGEWPVDPARVYLLGHSNGGFMAYRMACERADIVAGIASLAGLAATTPANCTPEQPVNVLQIHGTVDDTVPYAAGSVGAENSVAQWADHNGCGGTARSPGAALDLDTAVVGAETQASSTDACPDGGAADLWRMEGSGHIPGLAAAFRPAVLTWFADHSR